MRIFLGIVGLVLLLVVLLDAFETIILPRRVTHGFRLSRTFLRLLVRSSVRTARLIHSEKFKETYLSYWSSIALLLLFVLWAALLVLAFALLQWGAGSEVVAARGGMANFRTDLYLSGTTFFTLGMGDVLPLTTASRALVVLESGIGFGFLAIIIAYLPTLYTAFSQREVNISLLDARAGSPPTAGELMRRHGRRRIADGLGLYLRGWEIWSAELMESHLTYPILCFFRSQHHNQSWLAALTSVLDVCALIIAYGEGEAKRQAELTFVTTRHAVADLAEVLGAAPHPPQPDRFSPSELAAVRALIIECGVPDCTEAGDAKLQELRGMYEPIVNGLSKWLLMPIPSWGAQPTASPSGIWARVSSGGQPIASERGSASADLHSSEGRHF